MFLGQEHVGASSENCLIIGLKKKKNVERAGSYLTAYYITRSTCAEHETVPFLFLQYNIVKLWKCSVAPYKFAYRAFLDQYNR